MRRLEAHGIFSNNTIRRAPKDGGKVWVFSSRKSNATNSGFLKKKKIKCSVHGTRMCVDPVPDKMTRRDKRDYNNKIAILEKRDCVCENNLSEIDIAYLEYNKMRREEIDLDKAYLEYEKIKKEWVLVTLI